MLNYISQFEQVQIALVLGVGLVVVIFSVGFNIRKGLLVEDVKAENDMRRKILWHNIENRKVIESKTSK